MELTLAPAWVEAFVREALAEDVGSGDVTTDLLVDPALSCAGQLLAREPGTVAGLAAAEHVFRALDPAFRFDIVSADGTDLAVSPSVLARLEGNARALLTAERTALNLLGRLSGIATLTRSFVDAVEGTGVAIRDTRKTTPGLRALEKEAVRCGGGENHRLGLFDAVLVKDNHLALSGGIRAAVERLRASGVSLPIAVETETLDDVREALACGVDRILLDNMPVPLMREAVALGRGRATFEASGGITLATVRQVAETGIDFISVGALTHSAHSLDVSLEVSP